MFGLSMGEIVIIAILALLLLGPDKLPDAAKTLGKTMREIRKATDDLKDQVEREIYTEDKPKPAVGRPSLVPPVPTAPVPGPAGPPPAASTDNVPGLEAALAEVPLAVASTSVAEPPPAAAPAAAAQTPDAGKVP
jgi:sec-independent protein translocase protein TatB